MNGEADLRLARVDRTVQRPREGDELPRIRRAAERRRASSAKTPAVYVWPSVVLTKNPQHCLTARLPPLPLLLSSSTLSTSVVV